MSARKKEPLYLTLFPQLVVLLGFSIVVVAIFTIFNYFILRSIHLSKRNIDRVFDWGIGKKSFMTLATFAVAIYVGAFELYQQLPSSLYATLPISIWLLYLLGKNQAMWMLGVIFDHDAKIILIPPTIDPLDIVDFLLVAPAFKHLTKYDELPFDSIAFVSRQAGRLLFLHGNFTSRKLEFTNKLKRDEALFLITKRCGIKPQMMRGID